MIPKGFYHQLKNHEKQPQVGMHTHIHYTCCVTVLDNCNCNCVTVLDILLL